MRRILLSISVSLTVLPALASDAGFGPLVDAAWLAEHIDDPDLVLLHVGEEDAYANAHLPGARLVSLDDVSVSEHTRKGLMLEMPSDEDLRKRLEGLGISDGSRVVVYYGQDWVSPSTRVLFTLQYAGLGAHSALLDGGQSAWVANGGAVTKETVALKPGSLSRLNTEPLIVDAQAVRAQLDAPGVAIVDGRASVYYDGVEVGGGHGQTDARGHIRGAHSVPYTELTDAQLRIRPKKELVELFAKAGIEAGDTVIAYCHIGQQATAALFAARLLGHPIQLYDGSFQDWSRGTDRPVDGPAEQTTP